MANWSAPAGGHVRARGAARRAGHPHCPPPHAQGPGLQIFELSAAEGAAWRRGPSGVVKQLAITCELPPEQLALLIRRGLDGAVTYWRVDQHLVLAVRTVAAGGLWAPRAALERVAREPRRRRRRAMG